MAFSKLRVVGGIGLLAVGLLVGSGYGLTQVPGKGDGGGLKVQAPAEEATKKTQVYALKHSMASEVAETLRKLYLTGAKDQPPLAVAADERTNSVIVQGKEAKLLEIEALVQLLDAADDNAKLRLNSKRKAELAQLMLEAAKQEFQAREEEFNAGRAAGWPTIIQASLRVLEAEKALTSDREELSRAYKRHFTAMRGVEDMAEARFKAGQFPLSERQFARFSRYQAELWFEQSK